MSLVFRAARSVRRRPGLREARPLAESLEGRRLLTIDNPSVVEGGPGTTADMVFTVTFTVPVRFVLSVDYLTVDGTATAAGGDYTETSGNLTFTRFNDTAQVHVPVRGDAAPEPDETFTLELTDTDTGESLGTGVGTIVSDEHPPVIESMTVTPNLVTSGTTITVQATVSDADPGGYIANVAFFRETDGVPGLSAGDFDYFPIFEPPFTLGIGSSIAGTFTYYARATDNTGATSAVASATVTVTNTPPTIDSFTASPNPVYTDEPLTMRVAVSDPEGNAWHVAFYHDIDAIPGPSAGDMLLGDRFQAPFEWTGTVPGLTPGLSFFAVRATDLAGQSDTARIQLSVLRRPPPDVASLTDAPDPVVAGDFLTLAAGGVGINATGVSFCRESNGVEGFQQAASGATPADLLVGTDTGGADGFRVSVNTTGLAPGRYAYYAVARDADGRQGAVARTTNNVSGVPDRYELNNSFDSATDFGTVQTLQIPSASLHTANDLDYFRFTAAATGKAGARLYFRSPDGRGLAALTVYDAQFHVLAQSPPIGATSAYGNVPAALLFDATQGRTYYLHVGSPVGAVVDDYLLFMGRPSTIGSLTATPDPTPRGAPLTLTASGVTDPDGDLVAVHFLRESNGIAGVQFPGDPAGSDTPVGGVLAPGAGGVYRLQVDTRQLAPGQYTYYAAPFDNSTGYVTAAQLPAAVATATHTLLDFQPAIVTGRRVYYRHGGLDTRFGPAGAVATDKQALRPGQGPATFQNVTSFSGGLNGLLIDLAWLPGTVPTLDAGDFDFAVSSGAPGGASPTWTAAPAPESIGLTLRGAPNGDDRAVLAWRDGAIRNQWLRVTVKPTAHTGLSAPDVFYFGNLVAESGQPISGAPPQAWRVDAADAVAVRRAISRRPVDLANRYDLNRDGVVDARDLALARANYGRVLASFTPAAVFLSQATATKGLRRVRGAYELLVD